MPTMQVSDKVFAAFKKLRRETPDKERKFEPYNAVAERLLIETGNLPKGGENNE